MEAPEARQAAQRHRDRGLLVAHIELHHFISRPRTGVFNGHLHTHLLPRAHLLRHLELGIIESGIGEAVAEGIEGLAGEITIGTPGHGVLVEGGEIGG